MLDFIHPDSGEIEGDVCGTQFFYKAFIDFAIYTAFHSLLILETRRFLLFLTSQSTNDCFSLYGHRGGKKSLYVLK
jgi:hypothetical protein